MVDVRARALQALTERSAAITEEADLQEHSIRHHSHDNRGDEAEDGVSETRSTTAPLIRLPREPLGVKTKVIT